MSATTILCCITITQRQPQTLQRQNDEPRHLPRSPIGTYPRGPTDRWARWYSNAMHPREYHHEPHRTNGKFDVAWRNSGHLIQESTLVDCYEDNDDGDDVSAEKEEEEKGDKDHGSW